ncbi:RNA polymerase sigma factor [Longitalea luteola]|uniref:RNA polymerase sigma factor n=1 Tax=Longitalea luteola TaxID=2812563 RepID=UPI001A9746A5|nr:RNA polymerase sigma factor [Longitalea luteola]
MLSSLKEGNHNAFTDVFDIWKHKVYSYFLKKTKQAEIAKELTQDTFIKLWKYRAQMDEAMGLDQQIFQKARQVYIDWLRKEASYRQHFYTPENILTQSSSTGHNNSHEIRDAIHSALNRLPEKRKQIFELKHVHGYSYKEIAQLLGISTKTVDSQLLKALSQLRKTLSNSQFVIIYILFFMD